MKPRTWWGLPQGLVIVACVIVVSVRSGSGDAGAISSNPPLPTPVPTSSSAPVPTSSATSPSLVYPEAAPAAPKLPPGWSEFVDPTTLIRFALPQATPISPQERSVSGTVQRTYTVQVTKDFGVTVGFIDGVASDLRSYPDALVNQFKQVGAKDAKTQSVRFFRVHGDPAIDFRLSFTPLEKHVARSAWFVRRVDTDRGAALFQTIAFPQAGHEHAVAARARKFQRVLIGSVRFP